MSPACLPSCVSSSFRFDGTLSLVSLLAVISALVASAALAINAWQARRTNLQVRMRFLMDSLEAFSTDPELREAFYAVEYNAFVYTQDFHRSAFEPKLDRLLRLLTNLAKLCEQDLLRLEELDFFGYYYLRVSQSADVRAYIESLRKILGEHHPYERFLWYGAELERYRRRRGIPVPPPVTGRPAANP